MLVIPDEALEAIHRLITDKEARREAGGDQLRRRRPGIRLQHLEKTGLEQISFRLRR